MYPAGLRTCCRGENHLAGVFAHSRPDGVDRYLRYCFLDWVLFANLPMFRLEGTEHMDKAYHQKWFHAKGMLFPGIIFALIPSTLVGLLIMVIR